MPIVTPRSPACSTTGRSDSRSSTYAAARSSSVIRHTRPVAA